MRQQGRRSERQDYISTSAHGMRMSADAASVSEGPMTPLSCPVMLSPWPHARSRPPQLHSPATMSFISPFLDPISVATPPMCSSGTSITASS